MSTKSVKGLLLLVVLIVSLFYTAYVDSGLAIAFLFLLLLLAATYFFLEKYKLGSKHLYAILAASLIVHLCLVLFIHYYDFRPFGGGADYESYHVVASQISQRFLAGNFSLHDLHYGHDFPVLIAVVYAIFGPYLLVSKFLIVWFFVMAVLLSYLIVKELGGNERVAVVLALAINFYPSYAYFGSLLLKDTIIIPLTLLSLLISIQIVKNFSWKKFIVFFLLSVIVTYLRFYIGYALIFSFIFSWFFSSDWPLQKRILLGAILSLIIGFAPFVINNGYFGYKVFFSFLSPEKITLYREVSYNPNSPENEYAPGTPLPPEFTPSQLPSQPADSVPSGTGSSFVVETGLKQGPVKFIENSLTSFTYALLGPFLWQLRYGRQSVALVETLPWYMFIIVFLAGAIWRAKKEGIAQLGGILKKTASLWSFAILGLGALSLFINNYGIIVRIRIPMVISLAIVMLLVLQNNINALYEKISRYWRGRVYRV